MSQRPPAMSPPVGHIPRLLGGPIVCRPGSTTTTCMRRWSNILWVFGFHCDPCLFRTCQPSAIVSVAVGDGVRVVYKGLCYILTYAGVSRIPRRLLKNACTNCEMS